MYVTKNTNIIGCIHVKNFNTQRPVYNMYDRHHIVSR